MSNPTEAWSSRPGGLASQMRRLREDAGLTGAALAARVGWTQPRVSKIENGKQLPTEDDIRAVVGAVGASEETLRRLLELRSQASVISREWRLGRADGQAEIQRDYDNAVRAASVVRNFEVTTVPGLLQTPGYARHQALQAVALGMFDEAEVNAALAAKQRRQEVLYEPGKRFEFLITEAVLRFGYCPADVMLAQLDRLNALTFGSSLNVWFGIIPFRMDLPVVPQNRFIVVDDQVLVEHFAGDEAYRGDRAATYHQAMDLLKQEAVTESAARELIAAAMQWISDIQTNSS